MFATLGTIAFKVLPGFTGFHETSGADFAEHALARGKPRLQWIGEKLDELDVQFGFHHWFCDPRAELDQLKKAKAKGLAMGLVFGNGDYRGRFVLTELEATYDPLDGAGNIIAVSGSMKLREFIGDPAKPQAPAVSPFSPPPGTVRQPPAIAPVRPGVAPSPDQVLPASASVLSGAHRVAGLVERAAATAQQALVIPSPARAGELAGALDAGLSALGVWLPAAVTVGQAVPAMAQVAAVYREARGLLISGRSSLDGARRSNVAAKLALAAADAVAAQTMVRAGAVDRARLGARVGGRWL
jgi:phage protein U